MVLPEIYNNGYVFELKKEVESLSEKVPDGGTTYELDAFAREKHVYVVAGLYKKGSEDTCMG